MESKVSEEMKQKSHKEIAKKSTKLKKLKIEWVTLRNLKPNWYNPNRQSEHEFALLCQSMKEDGFTQPIIALRDGTIVDGEHRWRAAEVLEMEEVPVVIVEMEAEQMRISTLRHNRARGSEDMELVANVMKDLRQLGAQDWMKDSLLMDDVELAHMFEEVENTGTKVDVGKEFEISEERKEGQDPLDHRHGTKAFATKDDRGRVVLSSLTKEAADKLRQKEKEAKERFGKEESAWMAEARDIVTFSFVYTDEEAVVVKAVLGNSPAERVLKLCQLEMRN